MNDELYHHGVDGQRWGIKHGPPYPLDRSAARQEAKKRKARRKNMIKINKKRKKSKQAAEKRDLTYKKSKKPAKQMTNKELNDTIDRLQREETYRQLVSKTKTEKKIAKELKKRNKIADKQQKIQNEAQQEQRKLQQEQLDLQKKQFKQSKKANAIVHKVIDRLVTNAASTIGTKVTENLINNAFAKDNAQTNNAQTNNSKEKYERLKMSVGKTNKKEPYTPPVVIIDEKAKTTKPDSFKEFLKNHPVKESYDSPTLDLIDFSKVKFAGGDWNDSETGLSTVSDIDGRLIQLWNKEA